jgi:hypothetical protein
VKQRHRIRTAGNAREVAPPLRGGMEPRDFLDKHGTAMTRLHEFSSDDLG